MQLVDHDEFIKRLEALFDSSKALGAVWLRCKRDVHMVALSEEQDAKQYSCLLKAVGGHKTKFSTLIMPGQLLKFHALYGALLKASMSTLRKRDKKRERQKAEDATQRKKRLAALIPVEGPKRGNGRRKRQRLIKAAQKQQSVLQREGLKEKERARQTQIQ